MNSFNKTEAAVFSCRLCFLRAFPFISLVSGFWFPKSKQIIINISISHIIIINRIRLWISLNLFCCRLKNVKQIRAFLVPVYNFLINSCHSLMVYIPIKIVFTLAHEKMLFVEISLVSQNTTFLQYILDDITCYTFNTIYWQNIFLSVKQMCSSVLLNLNIKLFFEIKNITQLKRYRRQMNVCKYIFMIFSNSNIISKIANACVTCPDCFLFHGHYTIFKDKT